MALRNSSHICNSWLSVHDRRQDNIWNILNTVLFNKHQTRVPCNINSLFCNKIILCRDINFQQYIELSNIYFGFTTFFLSCLLLSTKNWLGLQTLLGRNHPHSFAFSYARDDQFCLSVILPLLYALCTFTIWIFHAITMHIHVSAIPIEVLVLYYTLYNRFYIL